VENWTNELHTPSSSSCPIEKVVGLFYDCILLGFNANVLIFSRYFEELQDVQDVR
jgi:hypothetical protein